MFESYMAELLRHRWMRLRLYRFDRLPDTEKLRQNADSNRRMKSEITTG